MQCMQSTVVYKEFKILHYVKTARAWLVKKTGEFTMDHNKTIIVHYFGNSMSSDKIIDFASDILLVLFCSNIQYQFLSYNLHFIEDNTCVFVQNLIKQNPTMLLYIQGKMHMGIPLPTSNSISILQTKTFPQNLQRIEKKTQFQVFLRSHYKRTVKSQHRNKG